MFKKIVESIKDLVQDTNLECATAGITLQAMDSSHVSLVSLLLNSEGFDYYRCDRNISLGLNLVNVAKITQVPSTFAGHITYHDSCSGLRELGVKQQPRAHSRGRDPQRASQGGSQLSQPATPKEHARSSFAQCKSAHRSRRGT